MTGLASSTVEGRPVRPLHSAAWHLLAVLLVAGFANAYEVWRFLGDLVRPEVRDASPFIAVAVAAFVAVIVRHRLRAGLAVRDASRGWIAAATAVAAIGLVVADPTYPAKRIHVAEYMLLAIVVRAALAGRTGGTVALVMTFFVAGLYGVHDELIQGFHPDRSYGARDILVNLLGTATGVCLLRAVVPGRVSGPEVVTFVTFVTLPGAVWLALTAVTFAVAFVVLALAAPRHGIFPLWTIAPVVAAGGIVALVAERQPQPGLRVVAVQLAALALYPVLAHVAPLEFS